jgi:hypothetical protein
MSSTKSVISLSLRCAQCLFKKYPPTAATPPTPIATEERGTRCFSITSH